ncbi:acetate--CoA ligase family protein [Pontitalea aquivivens]|uniref:acetate--CoA ligase family protein n=1 Tax=Pontitalea aquivivens TaxID=3388663 RepID=UPI003970BE78
MSSGNRAQEGAAGLEALFSPRSVAVIGASSDITRIRGKVLRTLVVGGFRGRIFPVNPSHSEVQGMPAFASIRDVPEPVDLAMIAVAAEFVPAILEDCAAAGVRAAVVYSSASASGGDQAPLHEVMAEIAGRTGMRILGPNTEGIYNVAEGIAANFSIVVEQEEGAATKALGDKKGLSIVSHSGGLGFGLYSRARLMHLPVRHVVATGNECDVDALSIVEYLIAEGNSTAILLFIEGFKNSREFARVATSAADAGVPLIVMKVGRSAASQRAAVSHTGHLTGTETAYDAVFCRYGVIRVSDPDEMISIAAGFCQPLHPAGGRVCVLTGTGGTGAWVADLCSQQGLDLPPLDTALHDKITAIIPESGAAVNPIDVTASIVDDRGVTLASVLRMLATAEQFDSVVLIFSLAPVGRIALFRPQIESALAELGKPVFFVSQTLPDAGNIEVLAELGIRNYSFQGVAHAIRALNDYRRFRQRWAERTFDQDHVSASTRPAVGADSLVSMGFPLVRDAVVADCAAAVEAAADMGYPVAVKIVSPDIPHKTEAGGVALNLLDAEMLRSACERVLSNVARAAPDARIEGLQVQKMAEPGVEMVVGAIRDVDFGPIVMLGVGGIFVEVMRDTVFEPTPIGPREALDMVSRLKGLKLLQGPRGTEPSDVEALADVVLRLSRLMQESPEITEIEFNPVIVHSKGRGVTIADALLSTAVEVTHA